MPSKSTQNLRRDKEIEELRRRLAEAEDTLSAIRQGEVDALVVNTRQGDQVFTLKSAERPYRIMVEQMTEGALTLSLEGAILFCNQRFATMVKSPLEKLMAASIYNYIAPESRAQFQTLVRRSEPGEISLLTEEKTIVPTVFALSTISLDENVVVHCAVVTDLTEEKRLSEERKNFTRRLMQVQEEERKRISRDLHDETAQKIALMALELDSLCQKEKRLPKEINSRLCKIRQIANETVQEVRRFSHELRPSVLEHFGLAEAMELIIGEMNSLNHVKIGISVTGSERRLADEVEIALFRIAQEALSNVRKHSEATQAKVNIKYTPTKVRLTISDNGKGFSPDKMHEYSLTGSLGLVGMRERAQLIGGQLDIKSLEGIGTTVAVEVSS